MGNVRTSWIDGPVGRLEAALRLADPARAAAVLSHPHPLYGGSLHNPVVFHADRELNRRGFATLRFNFRGVDASEGGHDEGRGEVEDLAAAVAHLRDRTPGLPLLLVGYSFGALCALGYAARDPDVAGVIAIGLPVRLYPLDELDRPGPRLVVVQGSEDELGSPEQVRTRVEQAGRSIDLHVVEGATHLFTGLAPQAAGVVVAAAARLLGRSSAAAD